MKTGSRIRKILIFVLLLALLPRIAAAAFTGFFSHLDYDIVFGLSGLVFFVCYLFKGILIGRLFKPRHQLSYALFFIMTYSVLTLTVLYLQNRYI